MIHIDFLTVFVAAVIFILVKMLWYSPYLFGKMWIQIIAVKKKEIRNSYLGYSLTFLAALILSYFIALIEIYVGASSFWDGVVVGFILWFGFVFPIKLLQVIWIKNELKLFLVQNGFLLISFMVMGAILVG